MWPAGFSVERVAEEGGAFFASDSHHFFSPMTHFRAPLRGDGTPALFFRSGSRSFAENPEAPALFFGSGSPFFAGDFCADRFSCCLCGFSGFSAPDSDVNVALDVVLVLQTLFTHVFTVRLVRVFPDLSLLRVTLLCDEMKSAL